MKKIGLICLALILALGVGGVAYASWNDTITIDGSVNTGTLDLSVGDFSGTWVYKVIQTYMGPPLLPVPLHLEGEMIVSPVELPLDPDPQPGDELLLVAHAVATQGANDHDVLVTFDNLFPCVDFVADFTVYYTGTIPADLTVADLVVTGLPANLATVSITGMPTNVQVDTDTSYDVKITIHVLQDNAAQGLTGTISGSIFAEQWNVTP